MRYFVMHQDERITDMPNPTDFHQKIDVRDVNARRAGLVPYRTMMMIQPNEHTVFPDVICRPVMLVTREVKDVIENYDEFLEYRQISYLDPDNELTQLYFIPMLDVIDCLSEKSEYVNDSRSSFSKVVIKRALIRDKSLFQVKTKTQRLVIIRLDLVESLLIRQYKGFALTEAVIEE
jgi:hypothetical protein